jgi:CRISPR/Cas system-associated endonuclease/helicase Cas3
MSYVSSDQALAKLISENLLAHGVDVWDYEEALVPGDNWAESIDKHITEADAVVFLTSRSWNASPSAQWETALAVAGKLANPFKRLIPLRIDAAEPPPFLAQYQYVDLRDREQFSTQLEKLTKSISEYPAAIDPESDSASTERRISFELEEYSRLYNELSLKIATTERRFRIFILVGIVVSTGCIAAAVAVHSTTVSIGLSIPIVALIATSLGFYFGSSDDE